MINPHYVLFSSVSDQEHRYEMFVNDKNKLYFGVLDSDVCLILNKDEVDELISTLKSLRKRMDK